MNLAKLLNPASEAHNIFDATDEDIYTAVMDAKKIWEGAESSSGDGNAPREAIPTWNEALHAVCALRKYTKGINSPSARKLEATRMLDTFGWETHELEMQSMTDTKITSYFPHS